MSDKKINTPKSDLIIGIQGALAKITAEILLKKNPYLQKSIHQKLIL